MKKKKFKTLQGYEWFIVPDERLTEFRNIIVNLTTQILKPDEKIRKQPVRAVNKCKQVVVDAPQNMKPDEKEKIRRQPDRSVKKK